MQKRLTTVQSTKENNPKLALRIPWKVFAHPRW